MEPSFKRPKIMLKKDITSNNVGELNLSNLLNGCLEGEDSMVEVVNNNIYFYTEVSTSSSYQLVKALRKLDIECQEKAIRENTDNLHINLHIHSYGGDLFGAFAVIDVIRTMNTPVHSYIEGMAASAATLISVVCDKRYIYKYSYMLIHQLSSGMWGKYQELEDEMKSCKDMMKDIKGIYSKHTKLNKKELNDILKHDVWWNSKTCLDSGLVDEVL